MTPGDPEPEVFRSRTSVSWRGERWVGRVFDRARVEVAETAFSREGVPCPGLAVMAYGSWRGPSSSTPHPRDADRRQPGHRIRPSRTRRQQTQNTDGLLRQRFPRGRSTSPYSPAHLDAAQLNARPQRILDWKIHRTIAVLEQALR